MSNLRPVPEKRFMEAAARLRHHTDFVVVRELLERRLEYYKDQLVAQTGEEALSQTQGRARELQDLLKYLTKE